MVEVEKLGFREGLEERYRQALERHREVAEELKAVTLEWQEQGKRLAELEQKLADLRHEARERKGYLQALETILTRETGGAGELPQPPGGGGAGESITGAAYRVLHRYFPHGLHYRELERILREEENIRVPGQDPAANLLTHLTRDGRFERVGRGVYRLEALGAVGDAAQD